jgi:hypothetical protein
MRAGARQHADRGRAPEGRGGVEAADVEAFAEDDAGAEEADARDDLSGHAGRAYLVGEDAGEHHEARGPDGDERVGAQAREALAPLALGPDQAAEDHGGDQVDRRRGQVDGEGHRGASAEGAGNGASAAVSASPGIGRNAVAIAK